jgi:hypothetical protein
MTKVQIAVVDSGDANFVDSGDANSADNSVLIAVLTAAMPTVLIATMTLVLTPVLSTADDNKQTIRLPIVDTKKIPLISFLFYNCYFSG